MLHAFSRKYLTRIQDAMGIKQILDPFHPIQAAGVLCLHIFSLAQTDPMFTSGGAAELKGFIDQFLGHPVDLIPLFGVIFAAGNIQMDVTVAGMADKVGDQIGV